MQKVLAGLRNRCKRFISVLMNTTLIVIHLIITLILVGVILLQNGGSGGLGSMGGGAGGGGVFSPRGAKNFLSRLTAILATAFICSSMVLAYVAKNDEENASALDSLLSNVPAQQPTLNTADDLLPTQSVVPITEVDAPTLNEISDETLDTLPDALPGVPEETPNQNPNQAPAQ